LLIQKIVGVTPIVLREEIHFKLLHGNGIFKKGLIKIVFKLSTAITPSLILESGK